MVVVFIISDLDISFDEYNWMQLPWFPEGSSRGGNSPLNTSKAGYSEFSGSQYVFVKLPAEDVEALENTRVIEKEKLQDILLLRKKLNTLNYRDCVARL